MKALLVGNSEGITSSIPFCLRIKWTDVSVIQTDSGPDALELVEAETPDVLLTDYMVDGMSSLELIGRLREFSDVPLVVLADGRNEVDRAKVLEAGADDCVTCASSALEVLSKLTALFRRINNDVPQKDRPTFVVGDLSISTPARQVLFSGKPLRLTPHEYELLVLLARNAGRVLSHRTLLEKAWGPEYAADSGLLKKYIYRLRKKLADNASDPRMILSERGLGYRFNRTP